MPKRKAEKTPVQPTPEATKNDAINKKVRTQEVEPVPLPLPLPGRLYWNGADEHVVITEGKQQVMVQGVILEAQLKPEGLLIKHCEEKSNKDEKLSEATLYLLNQLKHRRKELKYHKDVVSKLNARLENEDNMDEAEVNKIMIKMNDSCRLVRLHGLNIKEILSKTKIGVQFQAHARGLSAILPAGRLLHPAFLPKPACWIPNGMSLSVSCMVLPMRTEDRFEEMPFGLGDADCEWLLKHGRSSSLEEIKAKVEEYEPSAEAGNMYGQYLLGVCCYQGWGGVAKDRVKAVELWSQAVQQGLAQAQFNLGGAYEDGEGVIGDKKKAFELYTLAANQGNSNAQFNLGNCYEYGEGVDEDTKRAVQLYTLAAHQSHINAQYNLAACYENGNGVNVDLGLAREWYSRAAAQGDGEAINQLNRLDMLLASTIPAPLTFE